MIILSVQNVSKVEASLGDFRTLYKQYKHYVYMLFERRKAICACLKRLYPVQS